MLKHLNKLICTGVILSSLSWVAQAEVVDKVSKVFDVNSTPRLNVKNINGGVSIIAWDQNVIKVDATITADTQKDRDAVTIIIEKTGRGVNVESKYENNGNHKRHNAEVEYEIMVPSLAILSSIELVNGSLIIKDIKGEVSAELVNGSFNATGVAADTSVSSVNGEINISYQDDIQALERIKLETVNGAIKLYVSKDIQADVSVETLHGSITNDFGLSVNKHTFVGRDLEGVIGNGKVHIDIETVNGAVKILHN
ncbi:DUF4097 family beta strand repeat-containing protein [Thalassotalea piscium]